MGDSDKAGDKQSTKGGHFTFKFEQEECMYMATGKTWNNRYKQFEFELEFEFVFRAHYDWSNFRCRGCTLQAICDMEASRERSGAPARGRACYEMSDDWLHEMSSVISSVQNQNPKSSIESIYYLFFRLFSRWSQHGKIDAWKIATDLQTDALPAEAGWNSQRYSDIFRYCSRSCCLLCPSLSPGHDAMTWRLRYAH